ncbi:MAG: Cytochrome c oxidase, subunit [Bacillales bacterium]|jgi:cytochrome c oxidase subunit 4|nr:Cytochrome c oxidase, subunit [Bacillales bacterium]
MNDKKNTLNKQKLNKELKIQLLVFIVTLLLTVLAFVAVASEKFAPTFIAPFIVTLAVVQVIFQLYYFMHLKDKGNKEISIFLYGGLLIGVLTVIACLFIVWL